MTRWDSAYTRIHTKLPTAQGQNQFSWDLDAKSRGVEDKDCGDVLVAEPITEDGWEVVEGECEEDEEEAELMIGGGEEEEDEAAATMTGDGDGEGEGENRRGVEERDNGGCAEGQEVRIRFHKRIVENENHSSRHNNTNAHVNLRTASPSGNASS